MRLVLAAIVFDLVSVRGLLNKLLLGLAAPALPVALAVAFLMADGEARGRTPVGVPAAALAAPIRADVSLMVAESTVFWRRKKLVGAAAPPLELWFVTWGAAVDDVRLPADDVADAPVLPGAADAAAAPEALALDAASRVSPPDDARRPVLDDVAEMERCTLLWPEALDDPAVDPVEACEVEWPEAGTRDAGPEAAADASVRGARSDNELPDREPSLSKSVDLLPSRRYVANTSSYF